ncbi:uncharacterized protein LOC135709312 [Ochlerotatus camptorhynchus]|uniref:uncharacterized protein LOC135709312 n=1 Tax=Ochlerotatus camptorhynchus TaxID=644619 RepID=UPI0031E1C22B
MKPHAKIKKSYVSCRFVGGNSARVTKSNFAKLLKTAHKFKRLFENDINNCGLCPWDVNMIDFSSLPTNAFKTLENPTDSNSKDPFDDVLVWPRVAPTDPNQQKRRIQENVPSVATSDRWLQWYKKKGFGKEKKFEDANKTRIEFSEDITGLNNQDLEIQQNRIFACGMLTSAEF